MDSKIIFNDAEGSILIEDSSGNSWHMDGQGNIKVNAPKNIEMNAGEDISISAGKNITVSAGENLAESAGNDITQDAAGDITETSDNKKELIETSFHRESQDSLEVSGSLEMSSTENSIEMHSAEITKLNSTEKSNLT